MVIDRVGKTILSRPKTPIDKFSSSICDTKCYPLLRITLFVFMRQTFYSVRQSVEYF